VFNIDGTSNEASQISEAVNIVLQYKTHSEWILLVVFSLGKQNLIIEFLCIKDHNPEVNWEKVEVEMTYCPPKYNSYKNFWKTRRIEEQTIVVCQSEPFSQILKEAEELDMTMECERLGGELEDMIF